MIPNSSLPANVELTLTSLVESARAAFKDNLISVILFGSAVEGRLRATSDVNVIVCLGEFLPGQIKEFSPAVSLACAVVKLRPMFLLAAEVSAAVECFALKFADIHQRHRVLYGADPFLDSIAPRAAIIAALRQTTLNLAMRLRASYAENALQEDQLAAVVSDAAGPLRSAAAGLVKLETDTVCAPKEALQRVIEESRNDGWRAALAVMSDLRERKRSSGPPSEALAALIAIAGYLRQRVEDLP